jgi:hypothetical protein
MICQPEIRLSGIFDFLTFLVLCHFSDQANCLLSAAEALFRRLIGTRGTVFCVAVDLSEAAVH